MTCYCCIHTAPSGEPQNITGGAINSTSILIQWNDVNCFDRNGDITGYRIIILPSITMKTSESSFIVTHLTPHSNYTFQVAAVNVNGTGPNGTITLSTEAVKSKSLLSQFKNGYTY